MGNKSSFKKKNAKTKIPLPNETIEEEPIEYPKKKVLTNLENVKQEGDLDNINSKYILKKIFDNINKEKAFKIINYNKKLQNKLDISIKDYKELFEIYSTIEIEIIPKKQEINDLAFNWFINNTKNMHIFFNNNIKKEVNRGKLIKGDKVKKIKVIIDYEEKSFCRLFQYCSIIESISFIKFTRNNITDMSFMFNGCSSLKEINFYNFNTDNVTDMCYMFNECGLLNKLDLSKFNTEKVFDMQYMFGGCNKLKEINLSNFNTENVKNMNRMFKDCYSINYLPINNFNTGKVEEMKEMFYYCKSLKNIDLSNFNTSKVQNMTSMFVGCPNEIIAKIKNSYKNFTDDAFTLPKMDYDEEIIGCVPPPFDFDDDI